MFECMSATSAGNIKTDLSIVGNGLASFTANNYGIGSVKINYVSANYT